MKERLDEGYGEIIYEVGVGGEGILRRLGINNEWNCISIIIRIMFVLVIKNYNCINEII